MKTTLKLFTLVALLSLTMMLHASTSISFGRMDIGNCFPFMCNQSVSSTGIAMDYQEAYTSTAFSGPFTISSMSWGYWPFAGPAVVLGGDYAFYWGYSAVGLALTSNFAANYSGSSNYLGTAVVPAGGFNFGTTLTLSGITPFTYN